jgi:hypothetical protein
MIGSPLSDPSRSETPARLRGIAPRTTEPLGTPADETRIVQPRCWFARVVDTYKRGRRGISPRDEPGMKSSRRRKDVLSELRGVD